MQQDASDRLSENQRLTILEERVNLRQQFDDHSRAMDERQDRHFRTITWIVSVIYGLSSLLLVLLTFIAKNDFSNAKAEMEHRFEVLANQSLKRPVLHLQYGGLPLQGRIVEINGDSGNPKRFRLEEFELRNAGDGQTTGFVSLRIYLSDKVQNLNVDMQSISPRDEYGKDFVCAFYYGEPLVISPRETWWLTNGRVQAVLDGSAALPHDLKVRAVVFYGTEKPEVADFVIRLRQP